MNDTARRVDFAILGWGAALILVGLVLTLVKLDLVEVEGLGRLWPLLVIAGGLWQLATGSDLEHRRNGLWVALVGGWLLVNTLRLFGLFWHDSWPLLMIQLSLLQILWPGSKGDRGSGLLTLAVGSWLLLVVTGSFGLEWRTAWPLLLVFVGLSLVFRSVLRALPAFLGDRS
jgi:hypothetical protein